MKSNYELKELARGDLKGNWGVAIIVCVISWLLTAAFTGNGGREAVDTIWQNGQWVTVHSNNNSGIMSLVAFIVGGPINLGVATYFLGLARHKDGNLGDLFSGFNYFLKTFLMNLLITIFTFLWFLLLIIPGFIAMLKYSMAYFILRDNPHLTALEAIRGSKEMMDGNKERLFSLWLSFIGWFFIGILTLGVGFLYLAPYYNAAKANFYEDIKTGTLY